MARLIVLLSGRISSRKSTLCKNLTDRFDLKALSTRLVIETLAKRNNLNRVDLQQQGERLDRRTNHCWVRDALTAMLQLEKDNTICVVDAVRTSEQIATIRQAYGPKVIHIHLHAPDEVLARRYVTKPGRELKRYQQLLRNKTERAVDELRQLADVVIDTSRCTDDDVVVRAASHLGLYGREYSRSVDVLVGGEYGSEGKGHVVSYLAKEYDILVRVGGPNAGHTVFEGPPPYTYHHLPSGTRSSDAQLVIGPGAVIDVDKLLQEIADCKVENDRLSIDPQAMIISTKDKKKEAGIVRAIGSTGQGVGAALARRITDRGNSAVKLAKDVRELRPFIRETRVILDRAAFEQRKILLEGTQGTGLSLYHGQYPHVTSRDTTVAGCLAEAGISPNKVRKVMMVCRSYPIRVQSPSGSTSGPLSQELTWKEISERSGIKYDELIRTEKTSTTHRERRVSEFDWDLLRKAASLNAPTDIALTFTDYLSIQNRKARRYEQLSEETIHFVEEIERVARAPVSLIVTRFNYRSIIDRRRW